VVVSSAWVLEALHTMVIIFADREPAMSCPAGEGRCGDRCAGAAAGWEWVQGSSSSTVAEWGLVCGERYKVGLAQSIFFVGCMIGTSSRRGSAPPPIEVHHLVLPQIRRYWWGRR
jgi:OCT family organic cation transporter-like MFS transporter 4/5